MALWLLRSARPHTAAKTARQTISPTLRLGESCGPLTSRGLVKGRSVELLSVAEFLPRLRHSLSLEIPLGTVVVQTLELPLHLAYVKINLGGIGYRQLVDEHINIGVLFLALHQQFIGPLLRKRD